MQIAKTMNALYRRRWPCASHGGEASDAAVARGATEGGRARLPPLTGHGGAVPAGVSAGGESEPQPQAAQAGGGLEALKGCIHSGGAIDPGAGPSLKQKWRTSVAGNLACRACQH